MCEERGGSVDHHCVSGCVTAGGSSGGKIEFFNRGTFAFFVCRLALSAVELVDLGVAASAGL